MKPIPYIFIIENRSEEIQKAMLFGGESNKEKANYGSDAGIRIISGMPNVTYLEMLMQSIAQPFKASQVEFYSTPQQLALPVSYTYITDRKNAPFTPTASLDNLSNEQDNDNITVMRAINLVAENGCASTREFEIIDDNSDISMYVLPKTIIVVKVYPAEKPDFKMKLSGAKPEQER